MLEYPLGKLTVITAQEYKHIYCELAVRDCGFNRSPYPELPWSKSLATVLTNTGHFYLPQ